MDMMATSYKPLSLFQMFSVWVEPGQKLYKLNAATTLSGREIRIFCPMCENPGTSKSASASLNVDRQVWSCAGKCGRRGPVRELIGALKVTGWDPRSALMKARNAAAKQDGVNLRQPSSEKGKEAMSEEAIVANMRKLVRNVEKLELLKEERGLTEATIEEWQIGWDGQRYTIPVRDLDGVCVNVRRYKLKATAREQKMLNLTGFGEGRIFRPDILAAQDTVVLTEGEMDCIILNQAGIPAVTHTSGAATFKAAWGKSFAGKTVYVCYDNDDGGRSGAKKAAQAIQAHTDNVYIIEIPIPRKGADITDFLHLESKTAEDFQELMAAAQPVVNRHKPVQTIEVPTDGTHTSLDDSTGIPNSEALKMVVHIIGKDNPPYTAPRLFEVNCDTSKGPVCEVCPVGLRDGHLEVEMSPNDVRVLQFVEASDERRDKLLKKMSGARCSDRSEFSISDNYVIERLTIGNSVEDRDTAHDQRPTTRPAFSVGTHLTEVNTAVELVGSNAPAWKNGELSFMAWKNTPIKASLDSLVLEKHQVDELSVFMRRLPDEERAEIQSPLAKCVEIAEDLAEHVTNIYGRTMMHVAFDLAWHSPMAFFAEGKLVSKGWLEMMVVGDTRTGKSEAATRLAQYYNAGIVKSCEGATFAGLVGGASQVAGNHWHTKWGLIPLNDRRLVVLDEVSGLKDKDVVENMSSIRSSGRAEITKISGSEETSARTRLIWISNPSDGSMIDDKADLGLGALRTIVKANEDIARFDYVMAVRDGDVDAAVMNQPRSQQTESEWYTKDLSQLLVMWCWSLRPEEIEITPEAEQKAREIAQLIREEYIADPPLLQAANARLKLYRIAVAMAARTFDTYWRQKGERILRVTPEHIVDAKAFLDELYSSPAMQYRQRSRRILASQARSRSRSHNIRMFLLEHEDTLLSGLISVMDVGRFRPRDFTDFAGIPQSEAAAFVKRLKDWGAVSQVKAELKIEKVLMDILRELVDEEDAR